MIIGVTGGVGAGKSTVLEILENDFSANIIKADDVGRQLQEPGKISYLRILAEFGEEILVAEGKDAGNIAMTLRPIDRGKLAGIVFNDKNKLKKINEIIHPFVTEEIKRCIRNIYSENINALIVIEAALLIEVDIRDIFDDLWCVIAKKEVRMDRLARDRGYSRQKCEEIMANQMTNEEFMAQTDFAVDNSGDPEAMKKQIKERLKYLRVI